ncbi:hypothetical protein HK405_013392 [Cladochytrium tenue]|nr:hypothetical protein HK405_013392 [Cladochytrium tenue]
MRGLLLDDETLKYSHSELLEDVSSCVLDHLETATVRDIFAIWNRSRGKAVNAFRDRITALVVAGAFTLGDIESELISRVKDNADRCKTWTDIADCGTSTLIVTRRLHRIIGGARMGSALTDALLNLLMSLQLARTAYVALGFVSQMLSFDSGLSIDSSATSFLRTLWSKIVLCETGRGRLNFGMVPAIRNGKKLSCALSGELITELSHGLRKHDI